MSLTRKIAHNTLYQVIGKVLSTLIGVAVVAMLTRHLGAAGYGQYATIIFYLSFFSIIADLGLYIILTKKISEPGADEETIASNIFTMRLITAIVLLGIAPFIALLFPYDPIVKLGIALTAFSFLFNTLNQVLWGIFQKHLKVYKMAVAENIGRVVLLAGTIAVVYFNGDLLWVMTTVVAGSFANFVATFLWTRTHVVIKLAFQWDVWKKVLIEAWPIALSIVFNLVYFRLDGVLLAQFQPVQDVGIYAAPYKILEVVVTLPAIFAGLALPILTNAFAKGELNRFRKVLQKSVEALLMIAVPMVVGTIFISYDLMVAISGDEFYISGKVLQPLILATGLIFIGNLFANTVVAINKQRAMIWGYGAVAVISVAGYLILIPRYSYMGAAWMTVAAEALIMIIAGSMVLKTTHTKINLDIPLRIVLSTVVMGLILWLLPDWHWLLATLIGTVVYLAMIVFTRALSRDMIRDIAQFRSN